ncbi:hypothetical protein [Salinibacter ruber]|jgi:hypothetical protein|uniref:hypothetical protein n=1 Tax=Salinibacter ruber TaxID=146919 RepID=UPI002166D0FF|nr:hypothetical protein [Salinibacter ruber]
MYRTVTLLLAFLLSVGVTFAQSNTPKEVVVNYSNRNSVGVSLVYEVREQIRESSQMKLVELYNARNAVILTIVTLDPNSNSEMEGSSTAYSATWSYLMDSDENRTQVYLSSEVGISGVDRLSSTARSLVAETDEQRRKAVSEVASLIQIFRAYGWRQSDQQ